MKILIYIILFFPICVFANELENPIEITSNTLEIFQKNNTAIFSGDVVVTEKRVRLNADTITVFYKSSSDGKGNVSKIEAVGNIIIISDENKITGNKAKYDVENKIIYIYENVVLTREGNNIKGDSLEYNINNGKMKISSSKGKRVEGFFVPENLKK